MTFNQVVPGSSPGWLIYNLKKVNPGARTLLISPVAHLQFKKSKSGDSNPVDVPSSSFKNNAAVFCCVFYIIRIKVSKGSFLILSWRIAQSYHKAVIVKENEIFLMFCKKISNFGTRMSRKARNFARMANCGRLRK